MEFADEGHGRNAGFIRCGWWEAEEDGVSVNGRDAVGCLSIGWEFGEGGGGGGADAGGGLVLVVCVDSAEGGEDGGGGWEPVGEPCVNGLVGGGGGGGGIWALVGGGDGAAAVLRLISARYMAAKMEGQVKEKALDTLSVIWTPQGARLLLMAASSAAVAWGALGLPSCAVAGICCMAVEMCWRRCAFQGERSRRLSLRRVRQRA